MTEAPPQRVKPPGKRLSIFLAVLVHALLIALLFYGIRWQTRVQDVVEVELVRQAPTPPPPAIKEEPSPQPKVEAKPEPKPEPPPKKPDIALKEKDKPKPKEPPKPPPKEEPKPKFDPFKEELAREEKDRAMERMIADEERKLKQQKDAAAASQLAATRNKAEQGYAERIRNKIRGNIVLPPDLKGNPSALFKVVLDRAAEKAASLSEDPATLGAVLAMLGDAYRSFGFVRDAQAVSYTHLTLPTSDLV